MTTTPTRRSSLKSAVQGRRLKVVDTRRSDRALIRILLKELFCVLYARRDIVDLIRSEVLHIEQVIDVN